MHELVLRLPEALVEPVSQALIDELDALSVSVSDADAGTDAEQAMFGEPGLPAPQEAWQHSELCALFESEAASTAAATLLLAQDWTAGVAVVAQRAVAERDWVRQTQSQFAPVEITPEFWIVPSWHTVPAQARRSIRLDPGLAFGTGTHPTTRMCLRWIARHAQPWSRVLDYGCGSGILAIAAALHGASVVEAVDIDASAVEATRANAQANDVCVTAGQPDLARGRYPLVLANILASPLKLLAPLLAGHLADGADLVLAGILERQADDVAAAYAPWLTLSIGDAQEGWILLTGKRTGTTAVA